MEEKNLPFVFYPLLIEALDSKSSTTALNAPVFWIAHNVYKCQ